MSGSAGCSSEVVRRGYVGSNFCDPLNLFASMDTREFFTRVHVEVLTFWSSFFSVFTGGVLRRISRQSFHTGVHYQATIFFLSHVTNSMRCFPQVMCQSRMVNIGHDMLNTVSLLQKLFFTCGHTEAGASRNFRSDELFFCILNHVQGCTTCPTEVTCQAAK